MIGPRGRIILSIVCAWFFLSSASVSAGEREQEPALMLNLPAKTLYVYQGNVLNAAYPVAIGKPSTPTPIGEFTLALKQTHPWWVPEPGDEPVPPGPDNPLGTCWMGLDLPSYGLHGTNAPWSIGHAVSKGCVRMFNEDAEAVYEQVDIGTRFSIVYERIHIESLSGLSWLTIYPDVYGIQPITAGGLAIALLKEGIPLPPPGTIREVIIEASSSTVVRRVLRHNEPCFLVVSGPAWGRNRGILAVLSKTLMSDKGNILCLASSNIPCTDGDSQGFTCVTRRGLRARTGRGSRQEGTKGRCQCLHRTGPSPREADL